MKMRTVTIDSKLCGLVCGRFLHLLLVANVIYATCESPKKTTLGVVSRSSHEREEGERGEQERGQKPCSDEDDDVYKEYEYAGRAESSAIDPLRIGITKLEQPDNVADDPP